jgi:hypothetical protein
MRPSLDGKEMGRSGYHWAEAIDRRLVCLRLRAVRNVDSAKPQTGAHSDRQVMRIIVYGLSLAFSVLIASTQTVRSTATGFTFRFTPGTLVAFLLGAAIVVPCFHAIFYSSRRLWRRIALAVIILIGVGGFTYPLRFVHGEARPQILIGLIVAACVLSIVATLMFVVSRFLARDEKQHSP